MPVKSPPRPEPCVFTPPAYAQGVHVLDALWVVDPDLPDRILALSAEVDCCDARLADLRRLILDEIRDSVRRCGPDADEQLLNRRYARQLMRVADRIQFKRPGAY